MNSKSRSMSSALVEGLLESEYTFQFTSLDNLHKTLQDFRVALAKDPNQERICIFKGVPNKTFDKFIDCENPYYRTLYFHETRILRIKMPSPAHEEVGASFFGLMRDKIKAMGLYGRTRSQCATLTHLRKVSKEPDGIWGPGLAGNATCILEVGMAESVAQLGLSARIWLEPEESHVNQVITAKIYSDRPEIIFQKWELTRREYGKTRSSHPRNAMKTHEVTVSLVNNIPTATDSLRLSFSKIYERPPNPATPEGDFIFTPDELADLAARTWVMQGKMKEAEYVEYLRSL
jgi:hypothetical protein